MSMSRIMAVVLVVIGLVAAGTTMTPTETPQQAGTLASTYTSMDGSGSGEPSSPPGQPATGKNGEAWAWTQLTPRGTVIRFATTELPGGCPDIYYTDINGARATHSMIRVSGPYLGPSGSQFPTTVCRLPVPNGARDAAIDPTSTVAAAVHPGTYRVPLPRWGTPGHPRPASVVVIGDTGCETTATLMLNQNCAQDWHFHGLAANAAATSHPDLVVHVGDYVYREAPQKANDATPGCNMREETPDWACLVKDFFRPAEALLAEAPFIFARGNHEACGTGVGRGSEWFRYLATEIFANNDCFSFPDMRTEPVQIAAGTLRFVLFDSSAIPDADDFVLNQTVANQYTNWFNQVNALARSNQSREYFLITHKPLWMVKNAWSGGVDWTGPTLAKAVEQTTAKALAPNIRLVLSGHEHLYQMLDFNSTRPPQLTVGSSGTKLGTAPDDSKVAGKVVDGDTVSQSISHDIHGYAVLRDDSNQWRLTFHDSAGIVQGKSCMLSTGTTKTFSCS